MYTARITATEPGFFALVVRVDSDGVEQVDPCYRGRHFVTRAAAERSTAKHIAAA
jgi:demethoxyubiquinone hydroxylase (CLK1/Coq7/Cat5 family)